MHNMQMDYKDDAGRVMRISWIDTLENRWAAVVVYAPVQPQDRPQFFSLGGPVYQALQSGSPTAQVLMAGDFNCVTLAADVFVPPEQPNTQRFRGSEQLQALTLQGDMIDAWRCLHPNAVAFTKVVRNGHGVTAGRTSRWYIPNQLIAEGWLNRAGMDTSGFPGDHALVHVQLTCPTAPQQGPGHWVLPLHLLRSAAYVQAIPDVIQAAVSSNRHISSRTLGVDQT
jgi:hypothetical protein